MPIELNGGTVTAAQDPEYESHLDRNADKGDSIMSEGISLLYKFMNLFGDLTKGKYDQMNVKADRARSSQQVANEVETVISKLSKAGDKAKLPDDVIQYLKDERIPIATGTAASSGTDLDKGDLDSVKSALETDSGRCSDFVTQAQLHIQKNMQSYNVCVSLVNSMQSLLAEMLKSIAQNIR
ncbi:MAG: secretion protein EspA [Burkholderiaceae bacterium]|nr:secretion protein EspA [Burkholderiaceae bacterium]